MTSHWSTILAKFGDGLFVFAGFISGITGSFVETEMVFELLLHWYAHPTSAVLLHFTILQADEIENFFAANPTPQAARTIQQSVEKVRAAAAWIGRDALLVQQWLTNSY